MYELQGRYLRVGQSFSHDGINYPSNWIELSTDAEKDAIGLVEVSSVPTPSYAYTASPNGGQVANDLESVKESAVKQTKRQAHELLTATDWYVVRYQELGTDVPENIVTFRSQVRSICETKVTAIQAETNVASVPTAGSSTEWPDLPYIG